MGKSLPSSARLQEFSRIITSNRLNHRPSTRQIPKAPPPADDLSGSGPRIESQDQHPQSPHFRVENKRMERNNSISDLNSTPSAAEQRRRIPLAKVVVDCTKRWFQDTLKEAKAGDTGMQVLVGQMYYSGYGIPRDPKKGRAWMNKASVCRSSVWKVTDKHPGYNASDSDSEDAKDETK